MYSRAWIDQKVQVFIDVPFQYSNSVVGSWTVWESTFIVIAPPTPDAPHTVPCAA